MNDPAISGAFLAIYAFLLVAMVVALIRRRSPAMGESGLFVLTGLFDGPRHGYGIVGGVAQLTDGPLRLRVGTRYGLLDRLVREGLVGVDREQVHQGRLRGHCRLTQSGSWARDAAVQRQVANARGAGGRAARGAGREHGGAP